MLVNSKLFLNLKSFRVRWKVYAAFNVLFFSCIFITLILSSLFLESPLYSGWRPNVPESLLNGSWLLMLLGIFIFNLAFSSLVFVTLPGFLFFPLSAGLLMYRGFLWGLLLYVSPLNVFVVALPTVLLEGEAYVFAAVAGTVVGVSWLKPAWVFRHSGFRRSEALKKALKESLAIYFPLVLLLFSAAIVETAAILFLA
jgi:hypothetical protein